MKFPRMLKAATWLPILLVVLTLAALFVRVEYVGDWDGLFILRVASGTGWVIKDDVYPEEVGRLIFHVHFEPLWDRYRYLRSRLSGRSYLNYEWDARDGRGLIKNYYPDGSKMIVALGRALHDGGEVPHGLFIGGGLPVTEIEADAVTMNETGMAYFSGGQWNHVWCTANEGLWTGAGFKVPLPPTSWTYVGSRVLEDRRSQLVIWSGHQTTVEGVPLRMDRYLNYRAGDRYVILAITITNQGDRATSYYYEYGDEPWVGRYGTSEGDIGWLEDSLVYTEGSVDTRRYTFAGMFDHGNPLIGEGGPYTGTANFIEWLGPVVPDDVYFSNTDGRYHAAAEHVPLSSAQSRMVILQWGPRTLAPGQSETMIMAIGRAGTAAGRDLPVKPRVEFELGKIAEWNRLKGQGS